MANLKIVLFSCSSSCLHLEFSHAIITRLRALFGNMTYFYIWRATMIRHGPRSGKHVPLTAKWLKTEPLLNDCMLSLIRMNVNTNALLLTFSSLQNKSSSPKQILSKRRPIIVCYFITAYRRVKFEKLEGSINDTLLYWKYIKHGQWMHVARCSTISAYVGVLDFAFQIHQQPKAL